MPEKTIPGIVLQVIQRHRHVRRSDVALKADERILLEKFGEPVASTGDLLIARIREVVEFERLNGAQEFGELLLVLVFEFSFN